MQYNLRLHWLHGCPIFYLNYLEVKQCSWQHFFRPSHHLFPDMKSSNLVHIQFCRINLSSNNSLSKEAFSVSCWVNFLYRQGSITTASKTHRTTWYKKPKITPWVIGQLLKFKPNVIASFFTGNILWKQQIKKLIIIIIVIIIIIYLFIYLFIYFLR